MIGVSILFLVLGFLGLATGIVLIIIKKTRKAGVITTICSVVVGIVFTIVLVVAAINEGAKTYNESAKSDSSAAEESYSSEAADDEAADDSTTTEEDSTTSDEGTRANPMPLNSPLSLTGTMTDTDTYDDFEASMDITVTETIRGGKAWELIRTENQFNEAAPEGKEYILNKIKVKAYDIASSENKFNMSESDFEYVSGTGTTYSSDISVVIPGGLDSTLYNDATGEGYIYGVVDKSDTAPLVKFLQFYFKTN